MSSEWVVVSTSAAETAAFGRRLGAALAAGDVVLLHGDLGAGKTTLAQGIAGGMGIDETVQSPTFTLVAEHIAPDSRCLHHLDLYRLAGMEALESFGFGDYLAPGHGVTVIEWPERAGEWLPRRYLAITLETTGPDQRRLTLRAQPAEDLDRFAVAIGRNADG